MRRALALTCVLASCTPAASTDPGETFRPRSTPVEYVGMTLERPFGSEAELLAILDPIFGDAAHAGSGHHDYMLQAGVFMTVTPDGRTPEQAVVTMEMEPSRDPDAGRRIVLQVPVSYAYGGVYIAAVRAALARSMEIISGGEAMQPWHLEYHVVSPNGGELTIQTEWRLGATAGAVRFITSAPRTSLVPGLVNTAAFGGSPYEQLGGTVNFELSLDEFTFFSNRAYGISAGALQNFRDFRLEPHAWLRLTVDPRIEDALVDVGFEVIAMDGSRVPFARAPASVVAGEQFQQNVIRMVDDMMAAEAAEPGSSTPFEVSFYYDDPEGGGVVSVIANGRGGDFGIAYTVASPARALEDVDFVPYQGDIDIPDTLPMPRSCAEVGSVDAVSGHFHVRFDASSTVRGSALLTSPLMGHVWGDIYRASDVTITGPNDGAVAVASFHFENVDVRDGTSATTYDIPELLPGGDYQILGFMDIDGNADPASPGPDEGDPVFIPIGGYPLRCADEPITVESALLLPAGR